jgi:hypothetical protein
MTLNIGVNQDASGTDGRTLTAVPIIPFVRRARRSGARLAGWGIMVDCTAPGIEIASGRLAGGCNGAQITQKSSNSMAG